MEIPPVKEYYKICALNINGVRDKTSATKIHAVLQNFKNEDVVCLVDTHLEPRLEKHLSNIWPGKIVFTHNTRKHTAGIAILFNHPSPQISAITHDPCGRFSIIDFTVNTHKLLLCTIYASATSFRERKQTFNTLRSKLTAQATKDHTVIVLGDFNMTENPFLDKSSNNNRIDPSHTQLQQLTTALQIEDLWRHTHPQTKLFTFRSAVGDRSRIDRIYTSHHARTKIKNIHARNCVHSDHASVHLHLNLKLIHTGHGTWILNQKLLSQPDYIRQITTFWEDWKTQQCLFTGLSEWWEAGKTHIKIISQRYSKDLARQHRKQHASLVKRLRNATRKADAGSIQAAALQRQLETQLQTLESERAEIHKIRAKTQWTEEGEKCTKFFLGLEKQKEQNTTIYTLQKPDGSYAITTPEILSEMKRFYRELYTAEQIDVSTQNSILKLLKRKLTVIQQSFCEGMITEPELKLSVHALSAGKSPGSDGLPTEFYTTFWKVMGADLAAVFNECFRNNILTLSQREAIIKCLPKKGDITTLKNWRPVSLLNVDYKILMRALAERLSKVLPFLISEDQTCNVRGRAIHHNTALIRDIIDHANDMDLKASLVSIDQMKAFDRVDWNFLFKTLERFNLGPNFVSWVRLAYTKISSKIKVNGFLSKSFRLERGVRQGCPLSAMLYILTAEVLAECIKQNPSVQGIKVEGTHCILSQYADDTTIFLTGDDSFSAIKSSLELYEKASGAKVHPGKCEGLWLGSNKGRSDNPNGYRWTSKKIKILGLYFGNENQQNNNWIPRIEAFKKTLKLWSKRNLSMKGKKIVINQLATAKLIYPAHTFPCPNTGGVNHIQEIQNTIWDFFWNGGQHSVTQELLILPVDSGGLGVVDVSRQIRSVRLTKIAQLFNVEIPGKWKALARYHLNKIRGYNAGKNIFKTFLPKTNPVEWGVSAFYRDLLRDWITFSNNRRPEPELLEEIGDEPIYHNPFVTRDPEDTGWPQLIKLPNWYKNTTPNTLTTIKNLCYEVIPGFHTVDQLQELTSYQMTPEYFQNLIRAIPLTWRRKIISQPFKPNSSPSLKIYVNNTNGETRSDIKNISTKTFYNHLQQPSIKSFKMEHISRHVYTEWERKAGTVKWPIVFRAMYKNHTNKRITDIQFKNIHFGLATRKRLFHRRLQTSPKCTRCKEHDEDDEHIFISCAKSKPAWREARRFIDSVAPKLQNQDYKHIVAGYADTACPTKTKAVLEDIRLCYFQAIWTTRNKSLHESNNIDAVTVFRHLLQAVLRQKRCVARQKNREAAFLEEYGCDRIFQVQNEKIRLI